MDHELAIMLTNILVALLSAGGFWALLEKIPNARRKKREENQKILLDKINQLDTSASKNREAITALSKAVQGMIKNMNELYEGQKECGVKIQNSEGLSRAYARDRLNFLSNKYMGQGYIPTEDVISYKLLGQAYIQSGGNSETSTKFNHCIEELPVLSVDDINRK